MLESVFMLSDVWGEKLTVCRSFGVEELCRNWRTPLSALHFHREGHVIYLPSSSLKRGQPPESKKGTKRVSRRFRRTTIPWIQTITTFLVCITIPFFNNAFYLTNHSLLRSRLFRFYPRCTRTDT